MKLWNKTLLASALCLTLFGCDDASKVDNKLDKAKDNAEQMKDAAADKAQAIKQDADKQIDTLKSQADAEADRLKDQASAIKAEADKKADAIAQQAKAQADAVKQNAKQESDRIVKEAGQIKDNAIGDACDTTLETLLLFDRQAGTDLGKATGKAHVVRFFLQRTIQAGRGNFQTLVVNIFDHEQTRQVIAHANAIFYGNAARFIHKHAETTPGGHFKIYKLIPQTGQRVLEQQTYIHGHPIPEKKNGRRTAHP